VADNASISEKSDIMTSVYANSGTHMVPLFQGYPPDEIISSSNPMQALLTRLESQQTIEKQTKSIFSFPFICGSKNEILQQNKIIKTKKKSPLVLSTGASAIVRLVDSRLASLVNNSIARDSSITPDSTNLMKILKSYSTYSVLDVNENQSLIVDTSKFKKIVSIFSYNALRNAHTRTLKEAIPDNVDENALIKEINQKFCQTFE
jgi:hypothetical protein